MKKIRITVSPKKGCYAISVHDYCSFINNYDNVMKRIGLCSWLTIMDIWSLNNSYIAIKTPKTYFEFPINLYSFLYSEDFDKCIYKWYSKKEVEIIKHNARKD